MKANTLVYLIDEVSLNRFLATSGFMLEKMSKNFKEIFILNFVDYKKKFNFFIDLNKEVKAEKPAKGYKELFQYLKDAIM